MNRDNKFRLKITHFISSDSWHYQINVSLDILAEWLINLSLLKYNLVEEITIVDQNIKIVLSTSAKTKPKSSYVIYKDKTAYWTLTQNDLDYWIEFFLVQYHDQQDFDHMDVELGAISIENICTVWATFSVE